MAEAPSYLKSYEKELELDDLVENMRSDEAAYEWLARWLKAVAALNEPDDE